MAEEVLRHRPRLNLVPLPEEPSPPFNPHFAVLGILEGWATGETSRRALPTGWILHSEFPQGKWTRVVVTRFDYKTHEIAIHGEFRAGDLKMAPPYRVVRLTAPDTQYPGNTQSCVAILGEQTGIFIYEDGSLQFVRHSYPNVPHYLRDHFFFHPDNKRKMIDHEWAEVKAPER